MKSCVDLLINGIFYVGIRNYQTETRIEFPDLSTENSVVNEYGRNLK